MADEETVDTSVDAPDTSVGDTEADTEPQEAAQAEEQVPDVAPQLTPEDIIKQAEERAFQRTASWMGRRDRDLIDNISNIIDARVRSITPQYTPPVPQTTDPATLLENPDAWAESKLRAAVPQMLDQEIARRTQAEQSYTSSIIKTAGQIMDSDPLFEDRDFGAEVVAEVQKQFGSIDKRLPPEIGAQMLINNSIASVYRRKTMAKTNPLAGNTPGRAPAMQTPPVASAPKVKAPKMSATAAQMAKRWGYKDEDLAKLFAEGK
jgi:hypothetical protein